MTNPTDVCIFEASYSGDNHSKNAMSLRLAVAENSQLNKNYTSVVKIYKKKNDIFFLATTINAYAPYRLEAVTITFHGRVEKFLAVGGMVVDKEDLDQNTKLSLFDLNSSYKLVFEMPMNVAAMKYVSTDDGHFIVVADKISPFTSFITVLKYDIFARNFKLHDRFPVAATSDIEAVRFGNEIYLIVAIFMDYIGNLKANSLVFKYNRQLHSFRYHSEFETIGARDIALFKNEPSYYVIIANEASGNNSHKIYGVPSFIYRIENDFRLNPVAPIATVGAKQIVAMSMASCNLKTLLIALDSSDKIDQMSVYVFDADRMKAIHVPLPFFSQASALSLPDPKRFTSFFIENKLYVAVATANNRLYNFLQIEYEIQNVITPLQKLILSLEQELKHVASELLEVEKLIANARGLMSRVVYKAKDQNVANKKQFLGGISAENMVVRSLTLENGRIVFQINGTARGTDPNKFSSDIKLSYLKSTLMKQEESLGIIRKRMKVAAFIDKQLNVTTSFLFKSAKLFSSTIIGTLECSTVDGVNTSFLANDVVMNGTSDIIHGKKSFSRTVTTKNIDLLGKLNNLDLSKRAATLHGDQIISSTVTEADGWRLKDSLIMHGTINGVNISTQLLSLSNDETVTGQKSFVVNLSTEKIHVKGMIDSVNITSAAENCLKTYSRQVITGLKAFHKSVSTTNALKVKGLVNSINLQKLSNETVNSAAKHSTVEEAQVFLHPVRVVGNLSVLGKVNSLTIPDDYVLVYGHQNISGSKEFMQDIYVRGNMTVSGHVDGKKPKELVSLSKDEVLTGGVKFMQDLVMKGNILIYKGNYVNGFILNKLSADIVKISGRQSLTGTYKFGRLDFEDKEPKIKEFIDGLRLSYYSELLAKAMLLNGDQNITGMCFLEDKISALGNLTVSKKINGISLPKNFLYNAEDQILHTNITFNKNVHFISDIVSTGKISGVNLTDIRTRYIDTDTNGFINGKKYFQDDVMVFEAINFHQINGVDLKQHLMRKNISQSLGLCTKEFHNIVILHDLDVRGNVNVSQTIDQIDISEFKSKVLLTTENNVFVHSRKFAANISAGYLRFHSLNRINFNEFIKDIMTINGEQIVSATHSFETIFVNSELKTNSTIDEIQVHSLQANSVLISGDFVINGKISFGKKVRIRGNVEVSGLIHGESLNSLKNQIILKTDTYYLNRSLSVHGNLEVKQGITCDEVNGYNPEFSFVLKGKSQAITGKKIFTRDVNVKGSIDIRGSVNDVYIRRLENVAVKKSVQQVSVA